MLEKTCLNRSRLNPESSTSIVISPAPCIRKLKSQESLTSIKNPHRDTETLESRYLALQNMYKGLMVKAEGQKSIVVEQNQEIEKLRLVHENNQEEIMKLRGMLGFLDKGEKSIKTQMLSSQHKKESSLFASNSNVRSSLHIKKYSNHLIKEQKSNEDSEKNLFSPKITESFSRAKIASPINSKDTTLKSTNPSKSGSSWVSRSTKQIVFDMKDTRDEDFEEIRPSKCYLASDLKNKYKFVSSLPLA